MFVPKWIMILVGCAAIWPLQSLRNQINVAYTQTLHHQGILELVIPMAKKRDLESFSFVYKDREQICVQVEGKYAK